MREILGTNKISGRSVLKGYIRVGILCSDDEVPHLSMSGGISRRDRNISLAEGKFHCKIKAQKN